MFYTIFVPFLIAVAYAAPSAPTFKDVQHITESFFNMTSVAYVDPSTLTFRDIQRIAESYFDPTSLATDTLPNLKLKDVEVKVNHSDTKNVASGTQSVITSKDVQEITESYYNAMSSCNWWSSYTRCSYLRTANIGSLRRFTRG